MPKVRMKEAITSVLEYQDARSGKRASLKGIESIGTIDNRVKV